MSYKIFSTEFYRDLHNSISTIVFSFIAGLVLCFVIDISSYITQVFESPRWNVDMLILPKGITPEISVTYLKSGSVDGLIPLALFNTLQQQIQASREQNPATTLKIMGFIPYKNKTGNAEIAVTDPNLKDFSNIRIDSIWSGFSLTDLATKRTEFQPSDSYQTPEWGNQVLMGIMASGSLPELNSLKNLIDRKTIAQAYFLDFGRNESHIKFIKLQRALYLIFGLISLSTLLGLWLALKNMKTKRESLKIVFNELKFNKNILFQVACLQLLMTVFLPAIVGFVSAKISFVFLQNLIFNL